MSRVLALLAGLALTAGVVLVFLNATVFDADGFAARVDASLRDDAVSAQVARRVTDQVLVARPSRSPTGGWSPAWRRCTSPGWPFTSWAGRAGIGGGVSRSQTWIVVSAHGWVAQLNPLPSKSQPPARPDRSRDAFARHARR